MANFYTTISSVFLASMMFVACGGNPNQSSEKGPSIKDNSNHASVVEAVDYSGISSSKLLLQAQAHYNLEEYDVAKDMLVHLMKDYTDSLDGVDLNELKAKLDVELLAIQKKKQKVVDLAQNERLQGSLNNMSIEQLGKETLYVDKTSPEFDTKECFYAYIKKGIYGSKLFFKVRYIDIDWLNIESYILNIDRLDYTLTGNVIKSETKGKKTYKVELLDKEMSSEDDMALLKAIAIGKEVKALYVGPSSYKQRDISVAQRLAIRNVLDAYKYLKTTE